MTIKVYGIPNCDTVKKSRKLLDALKLDYQFIDFKKTSPSDALIKSWIKEFGAEKVINKRGTTWRKLNDKEQAKADGSLTDQVKLIQQNTSMIKRPVIVSPQGNIIGFDKEAIEKLK